jgi:hypothetical protein
MDLIKGNISILLQVDDKIYVIIAYRPYVATREGISWNLLSALRILLCVEEDKSNIMNVLKDEMISKR